MSKKIFLLPLFALIFSACNNPYSSPNQTKQTPPSVQAPAAANTITAKNFTFSPNSLSVKPGTVITFTNQDSVPHDLIADNGSFDTGSVAAGGAGTFTAPNSPGTYAFHCAIHPGMKGTLIVQ